MSAKTIAQLKTDVSTRFPNNTSGLITPTVTREQFNDLVDSCLNKVDTTDASVASITDFTNGLLSEGNWVTSNTIVTVRDISDLPSTSGSYITLAANTTYLLCGIIDLGSVGLIMSANTSLIGANRFVDGITSATTDAVIKATGVNHLINEINITHTGATGKVLELIGSASETAIYTNSYIVSCYQAGTVAGWLNLSFRSFSIIGCTNNGLAFSGTCGRLAISSSTYSSNVGTTLNLGTATFQSIQIDSGNRFNVTTGNTAIAGAASSANLIDDAAIAILANNIFSGTGTYLTNITSSDHLWRITNNSNISDSAVNAQGYITGSALTTTFTGTGNGNEVLVNFGTAFVADVQNQFTISTAGRFTHNGHNTRTFVIDSTIFGSITGGTARKYLYFIYKNGSKIASSVAKVQYDGSTPASSSCTTIVTLAQGDYFDLRIQAVDATTAVIVDTCSINVYGI